jgi:uncharacterized protein YciW
MTDTVVATADVIEQIIGGDPTGRIAALRSQKPELADELQTYYRSIFAPSDRSAAEFSLVDRALVAIRVASHTGSSAVVEWYARLAEENGADPALIARAKAVDTAWDDDTRLGAAIGRADLVTLRPADTQASDIQLLKAAGFSPAGILSLSQTIAFVSYQLRLIAGLRALGEAR